MQEIDLRPLRESFLAAIQEDVGNGDLTSGAVIDPKSKAKAEFVAKQELVVAGIHVAGEILHLFDPGLDFKPVVADGESVGAGTVIACARGRSSSILTCERTALNYLQRLSGIATLTRDYIRRVSGTGTRIVDTRKTVPGLRMLDKYAVRCGGASNHRVGLFDAVLIKNNHLAFNADIAEAMRNVRKSLGHLVKVEIEVRTLIEVNEALSAGADAILLDNFTPSETRKAVDLVGGRVPLESSGGITLKNILEFAEIGVDYISVGALTHSIDAADIHLRVFPE